MTHSGFAVMEMQIIYVSISHATIQMQLNFHLIPKLVFPSSHIIPHATMHSSNVPIIRLCCRFGYNVKQKQKSNA